MTDPAPDARDGVTLDLLLRAVHQAFVTLVAAPAGLDVLIGSVVLVDGDDLAAEPLLPLPPADLHLHAGVSEEAAVGWLSGLAVRPPGSRPRALMSKSADRSEALRAAAAGAGVALVAVHPQTRWESLLTTVRSVLDHSVVAREAAGHAPGLDGADTDLFALAHTVASLTRGMVSIEDERSHVLAYSASDDAADELRRLSILGREGPADYLAQLHRQGVFERLRQSDEVVEVPADDGRGLRRRLAVGLRAPAGGVAPGTAAPRSLGALWVQEGAEALAADSRQVLRGAATVAARLIARALNAPSNEALQIQRLLGGRGGGVDIPSLAAALGIPTSGPAVVVGFDVLDDPAATSPAGTRAELASTLRLHASAYAAESLVTVIDDRIYALFPRSRSDAASWTAGAIARVGSRSRTTLRAAVAAPVAGLADVPAARAEVDRVLDGTTGDQPVTTLADSRTPVLLGEIIDLVAGHEQLRDPRVAALLDYDTVHSSAMAASVRAYLGCFGDVRTAAEQLRVHPNTLRYRLRRAEQILDIDLSDPGGRLLVEIQLAVQQRSPR